MIWGLIMGWGALFAIVSAVSVGFTLLAMFMEPDEPRTVLLRSNEKAAAGIGDPEPDTAACTLRGIDPEAANPGSSGWCISRRMPEISVSVESCHDPDNLSPDSPRSGFRTDRDFDFERDSGSRFAINVLPQGRIQSNEFGRSARAHVSITRRQICEKRAPPVKTTS